MARRPTDFSKSLDQLQGFRSCSPADGATQLVRDILASRQKPLAQLTSDEIGRLIVQLEGLPYILDLVFPRLEADPLLDDGYYPGDVLSNLIRAAPGTWTERPEYQAKLPELYRRALDRPIEEKDGFLDSLGLPHDGLPS